MKTAILRNKLLPLLIIIGLLLYQYFSPPADTGNAPVGPQSGLEESRTAQPGTGESSAAQSGAVEQAYADKRSKVWVKVQGRVSRTLPDDNEGHRHQRFILGLDSGHTVLVAHNIDLAERIPLQKNDMLEIAGRYEWNARGGVIHWTHHDPQNRHAGGWIRYDGKLYK